MVNPATGVAENSFPTATQDGVASAVSRLDAGFREWRDRSIADRTAVLSGVADLYVEQAPELAAIITREMGKTTAEALGDHEELFGPVAVVHRVSGIDEAVEMANSSPFGLGGAVFHTDPAVALQIADRLDMGMVWINTAEGGGPELPFGGTKRSGVGRELGPYGIDEFVNKKLIHIPVEPS